MEKLVINLNTTHKFNKHFKSCVGSGHATLALRKDYAEQLKFIHDTLGIEQVRFHGIFNDDMNVCMKLSDLLPLPGADRFKDICFDRIGEAFDNVMDAGMKPFVELGFMPKNLASDKNQRLFFFYGGYSCMPKDDNEWKDFIKAFLNYLIERYTLEEVKTWKFEVWNEPDLIVFFGGSKEDYFHLYEITAKAVKEVNKDLKVGGPSTSGTKWIKEFVSFVNENNIPCDFISTHQYAGDPIGQMDGSDVENKQGGNPFSNADVFKDVPDGSVLDGLRHVFTDKSETSDIRNDGIIINSSIAKKYCGDLPLIYTEWNENATFSAYTNDTRKVAAFLTMTCLKTENSIDFSSVWCFSDIFEELHMFNEEFHGGFGLLSHHGIPKPSYYALYFLTHVGDERYDLEDTYKDVTYAAFKDEKDNVTMLFTRQYMKNLDLEEEKISVDVSLNGVKEVLVSFISEDSGNPLKWYEKLNKKASLTRKEIEYIKENSKVVTKNIDFKEENGRVSFDVGLKCNDVLFVKFVK